MGCVANPIPRVAMRAHILPAGVWGRARSRASLVCSRVCTEKQFSHSRPNLVHSLTSSISSVDVDDKEEDLWMRIHFDWRYVRAA